MTQDNETTEVKYQQMVAMVPEDLYKRFKHLSIEKERSIKSLLQESIEDLLEKYNG